MNETLYFKKYYRNKIEELCKENKAIRRAWEHEAFHGSSELAKQKGLELEENARQIKNLLAEADVLGISIEPTTIKGFID